MNEEITVSPNSPEVAHENIESLEFLRELVSDGLQRHETLFRAASSEILNCLENAVRCGFYLQDARAELAADGKFVQWIESNFPISYARANQLRRLSGHFSRDLVDAQQRQRLGITPKGLDSAIGPHVRNQITSTGAKSLSDLFRLTGILPPLSLPDTNGNGKHPGSSKFVQFESLLDTLETRAKHLKVDRLSSDQREKLLCRLRPIVNFYATLRNSTERFT